MGVRVRYGGAFSPFTFSKTASDRCQAPSTRTFIWNVALWYWPSCAQTGLGGGGGQALHDQ